MYRPPPDAIVATTSAVAADPVATPIPTTAGVYIRRKEGTQKRRTRRNKENEENDETQTQRHNQKQHKEATTERRTDRKTESTTDNDNDKDTLRKVQPTSFSGLALQAWVMIPRKEAC